MKRLILLIFAASALAAPALARPASTSLTCAAARAHVQQQGAVLFDTSPTTFDRFVRDRSFCMYGEIARPAWVPTSDNPQCMVGYTCAEPLPLSPFRF